MSTEGINRLSAECIQDIDDVKTWARDHEIRMDARMEQLQDTITELSDVDDEQQKSITRNLKLLLISTFVFGSALAVVVALSGIIQIIKRLLDGSA